MEHEKSVEFAQDARKQRKDQLESLDRDFGVKAEVEGLDNDPIVPHRKRALFLACACILGEACWHHHLRHCCQLTVRVTEPVVPVHAGNELCERCVLEFQVLLYAAL